MNAIAIKLHETFGDEYEIYQNDIKQGLKEPCFLITLIDSTKENLLNTRSKRLLPFDILFLWTCASKDTTMGVAVGKSTLPYSHRLQSM